MHVQKTNSWGLGIGLAAVGILGLTYNCGFVINHDVAWLLYAARHMIHGSTLYTDLMATNPPLAFYLHAIPERVAAWTDLSLPLVFRISVILLIMASVVLIDRLPGTFLEHLQPGRPYVMTIGFALLVLLPGYDFGQREHLVIVLLLPYIVSATATVARVPLPGTQRLFVAFCAAIALCMKPQFAFVPILIESVIAISRRELAPIWRWENWVVVALGAGYVAFVLAFHPGYFDAIVPLLDDTYFVYQHNIDRLTFEHHPVMGLLLWIAAMVATRSDRTRFARCAILCAAAAGAYLGYVLQGTIWRYHIIPYYVANGLVAGILVAAILERLRLHDRLRIAVPAALFGLALMGIAVGIGSRVEVGFKNLTNDVHIATADNSSHPSMVEIQQILLHTTKSGDSVYIFSTAVNAIWPMVLLANNEFASRWFVSWPMIAVVRAQHGEEDVLSTQRASEIESMFVTSLISDLLDNRPAVILFDDSERKANTRSARFDIEDYLEKDPRYAALRACYDLRGTFGKSRRYRLLRWSGHC